MVTRHNEFYKNLVSSLCFIVLFFVFSKTSYSAGGIGSWNSAISLPWRVENPAAIAFNGYIYVLGGYGWDSGIPYARNVVIFAKVNSDGTIQPWASTTPFNTGRYLHAATIDPNNRVIYIIGGWDTNGNKLNDVQYAQILSDGNIGAWNAATPFPQTIYGHTAVAYNGYLYVLAGGNVNGANGVSYAKINSDGSLGAWQSNFFAPTWSNYHTTAAYNGIFLMTGGMRGSALGLEVLRDVQYAPVKPSPTFTGPLEQWKTTTPLLITRYLHASVAANGYLYVLGGTNCDYSGNGSLLNDVLYASINSDGTIGQWNTSNSSLPYAIKSHASVVSNGYIYVIGGTTGDCSTGFIKDTVLYAQISSSDTTPPVTTPNYYGGSYPNPINVTLTCSDGLGSGCDKTYYTKDGTIPTIESATIQPIQISTTTTLKYYSTDQAGNAEEIKTQYYQFTVTPPKNYADGFGYPVNFPDGIDWNNGSSKCINPDVEEQCDICNSPNDGYGFLERGDYTVPPDGKCESYHPGQDWNKNDGSDFGKPVFAIAHGIVKVALIGDNGGFGNIVLIEHEARNRFNLTATKKVYSFYAHLNSIKDNILGKTVNMGYQIGTVGSTGTQRNTGPHLHFEIRYRTYNRNNNCIDEDPYTWNWDQNDWNAYAASWCHKVGSKDEIRKYWVNPSEFIEANKANKCSITKVSIGNDGTQGNSDSYNPAISTDGSKIAFRTLATNISASLLSSSKGLNSWLKSVLYSQSADTNPVGSVYIYDRQTTTINEMNSDGDGTLGNGNDFNASFSTDGRYKVFASDATNLVSGDTNDVSDIFVYYKQTGVTNRASVDSSGNQANGMSYDSGISGDGRYVVFTSNASNLVSGDTNGYKDIFVHDQQTGETRRISASSSGTQADGDSYQPSISSDGKYVAFVSEATNLVVGDTNGVADIFVSDIRTGEIRRVSIDSNGNQANGASYHPSISENGRYVAFESKASNLVLNDSNGVSDIFIFDRLNSTAQRISVGINGVEADGASYEPKISTYGLSVAFISNATNLVSGDTNGKADMFVAYLSSSAANNPPTKPNLTYPSNGSSGLPTTITLKWERSTDPDGNAVTYNLYIGTDSSFAGTSPITLAAISSTVDYASVAGYPAITIFFVMAFRGFLKRRKRIVYLLRTVTFVLVLFFASCGGGGGGGSSSSSVSAGNGGEYSYTVSNLQFNTAYYWKVVADDGNGGQTESDTYSFTTR